MHTNALYCYIDNKIIPQHQATIPVDDRGLQFGDGVFETLRVHHKKPYQWQKHLLRLSQGLDALHIRCSLEHLYENCIDLIHHHTFSSGILKIIITRGSGSCGYLPQKNLQHRLILFYRPLSPPPEKPAHLLLSRWQKPSPSMLPVASKTLQGLNSTLARMEAQEQECFEALLLNKDGYVCEGTSSNIFWRKAERLFTPSVNSGLLPGIIRDTILTISPYPVEEDFYTMDDLKKADEVFITNTAWLVLPVAFIKPLDLYYRCFTTAALLNQHIKKHIDDDTIL